MRDPLDIIEQRESGGKNVPNYKYGPGFTASGHYQMINATWRRWARDAGIDVSQYPTAMSAPKEVQRAVAEHGFKTEGFRPWEATKHLVGQEAKYGGPQTTATKTAAAPVVPDPTSPLPDTVTAAQLRGLLAPDPIQQVIEDREKEQRAQPQPPPPAPQPPPPAPLPPPAPVAPPADFSALLIPRLRRGLLADTGYGGLLG